MRRVIMVVGFVLGLLSGGDDVAACCEFDPGYVAPASARAPTVASRAASLGLHRVTEVYAGETRITRGDTTTYSAVTVARDAGTYARKVASVGSGQASGLDARLSNPRQRLSDGRPVAGDVYENFAVVGGQLASSGYWFFADDAETRRVAAPARSAAAPLAPVPVAARPDSVRPVAAAPPAPASRPAPVITVSRTVVEERPDRADRMDPAPAPRATVAPAPTPTRPPRDVRVIIALAQQGDPLARIEVIRGRRVALWLRATIDGVPASVRAWRFVSGEVVALGSLSGGGDAPFVASWRSLAPAGSAFTLRFSATVDVPGEGTRTADASIDVVVRSAALVE